MVPLGHSQTKTLHFLWLQSIVKWWDFFSPPEKLLPKSKNLTQKRNPSKWADSWERKTGGKIYRTLLGLRSVLKLDFTCRSRRSHPCKAVHLHPKAFPYIHTYPPIFILLQYLFGSFCWEIFLCKPISMWAWMEGKGDERLPLCKFIDNRRLKCCFELLSVSPQLFPLPTKSTLVRKVHSEISWGDFSDVRTDLWLEFWGQLCRILLSFNIIEQPFH